MNYRELTDKEKTQFKTKINNCRKHADKWVFGYKKKEMIGENNIIVTVAKGEPGVGWIVVASSDDL